MHEYLRSADSAIIANRTQGNSKRTFQWSDEKKRHQRGPQMGQNLEADVEALASELALKKFLWGKLLKTLIILESLGKKAGHTPCFFSVEFLETLRLSIWFKLLEVLILWKNYEKTLKKWKKHSVLIIFPCHSLNQNSSTSDLSFSQVTEVEKRKLRKSFLRPRPKAEAEKGFWDFLFSTEVTWENPNQTWKNFDLDSDMEN